MKKKGQFSGPLSSNVLYILFFLIFFAIMLFFVLRFQNGIAVWEEFYASEVSGLINNAEPGSEVALDVTEASKIAFRSGLNLDEVFVFDNEENRVIVRLSPKSGTSYKFFRDVDVVDWRIEEVSGGIDTNRLIFFVKETRDG